jgi:obg-like ATPase 1
VKDGEWTARDIEILNRHLFITAKPVIYLANLSAEDYKSKKNKYLPRIAAWIKEHGGGPLIPYSAEFESQLSLTAGFEL